MGFSFDIDTKSLYFGITNDNKVGHTATVSTNLKQGNVTKPELHLIENCPSNIDISRENDLIDECLKNSKSECRINNILIFNKIKVNGIPVDTDKEFCMFLKEEIDPSKYQYGRIKLHYPISLYFENSQFNISNKSVMHAVQETLHGFAFVVRSFEFGDCGELDFIVSIIGEDGIPYSKVFKDYKGDSKEKFTKVFNEFADTYDFEIIPIKKAGIPGMEEIRPENYFDAADYCFKKAKAIAISRLLQDYPDASLRDIGSEYPYNIYDLELRTGNNFKYIFVSWTATGKTYFYLSNSKYSFWQQFAESALVVLVKRVLSDNPVVECYSPSNSDSLNISVSMLKFSNDV